MNTISSLAHLTDEQVVTEVKECVSTEREAAARLIATLAEFDDNLQLRCRAHNGYESERWFGPLIAREVTDVPYSDARSGPS